MFKDDMQIREALIYFSGLATEWILCVGSKSRASVYVSLYTDLSVISKDNVK